jgi:ATP-dependent helicase/nuclease subunit A
MPVRAAILWTDGPRIMEVPDAALDGCEQRLWQLDPASLDA